MVDASAGRRFKALDHERLAKQLSEATAKEVDPKRLPLDHLTFSDDLASCRFHYGERRWVFTLPDGPLAESDDPVSEPNGTGLRPNRRVVPSGDGPPTEIEFDNRLDHALAIFWVTSTGQQRAYGQLAPGSRKRQSTYAGHSWLLKDLQGNAVAAFVASSSHVTARIDGETPIPIVKSGRSRRARNTHRTTSPDGKWKVLFEQHNVVVVNVRTDDRQVVTSDGTPNHSFGGRVWWSPNSNHFVVMRTEAGQQREIHLIESAPEDSVHAKLVSVPYAKPGDRIDHDRPVLFSASEDWQRRDVDDSHFPNPFNLLELAWHSDAESFSFLYNQRGHQVLRLVKVDAATAEPTVLIDETSDTFICYSSKRYLHRLDSTDELIWMSERSGWNHLYLIDANSGEVKNAITSGDWVVRGVERVDEQNRQVYIRALGIDADQDPYHEHLVRVDFDGSHLVRLTSGDGTHRWQFSPNSDFLIDNHSRVDLPPVTQLRDASSGKLICELERADASALMETGWRPPERFVAKGRDGKTDIFGIIVRPTHFDPARRYPVLEHIYAGPHSAFVPKEFGLHKTLYSMAELGFVVVKIDGMGTSHRSKSFHDVCWKNLGDSGFPDRIEWIRQAAKTRPEMDLTRVGIWGGSAGGQSAMRALVAHGDFYRAAVSDCGCHDNRVDKIWWNEQWMGWPVGTHYAEQSNVTQAHRLQGDLMLIWGELDRNVDPASTVQVIDALVNADKDFEQLIIPGSGHGAAGHPYAQRRQADFFVRKLWHREPRQD